MQADAFKIGRVPPAILSSCLIESRGKGKTFYGYPDGTCFFVVKLSLGMMIYRGVCNCDYFIFISISGPLLLTLSLGRKVLGRVEIK